MVALFRRRSPGTPGVAAITDVVDAGHVAGGRHVVRLGLRVEAGEGGAFDAQVTTDAPAAAVALLRPGVQVGVRVEGRTVTVDLSRLTVTPALVTVA